MENVFLAIQLIVTLCLIGIVLLQRSEGGGLGMGGGGGAMTGRSAANAMTKLTWVFGAAFLVNAVILTVLSASSGGGNSVIDLLPPTEDAAPGAPAVPDLDNLLPPGSATDDLAPPRSE